MDPQVTSKPQMIDEVDRRLIQLEMEKLSLRKETKSDALKRVDQIDLEMEELQEKQVRYCLFRPVGSGMELTTSERNSSSRQSCIRRLPTI